MLKKRVAMQDIAAETRLFNSRAAIAMLIVCCLFSVILVNMYNLQVRSYQDYQIRSEGNRIKVLPLAPNRGLISDRNGILLAENRPVFSLELVPEQIDDIDATFEKGVLHISLPRSEADKPKKDSPKTKPEAAPESKKAPTTKAEKKS